MQGVGAVTKEAIGTHVAVSETFLTSSQSRHT